MCFPPDLVELDLLHSWIKGKSTEKKQDFVERSVGSWCSAPKPAQWMAQCGSKNGDVLGEPNDWLMFSVKPSNVKSSTIFWGIIGSSSGVSFSPASGSLSPLSAASSKLTSHGASFCHHVYGYEVKTLAPWCRTQLVVVNGLTNHTMNTWVIVSPYAYPARSPPAACCLSRGLFALDFLPARMMLMGGRFPHRMEWGFRL